MIQQGYGVSTGSKVLTIHEAQGLTNVMVVVVNMKSAKLQLHDSVPHAVVAITRHTYSCYYYSGSEDDAVKRLIRSATMATTKGIVEYNLKMAIKDRNEAVISSLVEVMTTSVIPSTS